MRVFVTVGTTKFDSLVRKVLSEDVLVALKAKGYNQVTIQSGKSDFDKKGSCLILVKVTFYGESLAACIAPTS